MTTIKLNQDLEIKGCSDCPFCRALSLDTSICSLNRDVDVMSYPEYEDEDGYMVMDCYGEPNITKPNGCPIIEIKSE